MHPYIENKIEKTPTKKCYTHKTKTASLKIQLSQNKKQPPTGKLFILKQCHSFEFYLCGKKLPNTGVGFFLDELKQENNTKHKAI